MVSNRRKMLTHGKLDINELLQTIQNVNRMKKNATKVVAHFENIPRDF